MHKFILIIFLLNSLTLFGQSNINIKAGPINFTDSESHWSFKLDSTHTKLTAYNEFSDRVWISVVEWPKYGPYNEVSSISSIRIMRDTIGVALGRFLGKKMIYIGYENSCCAGCGAVVYPSSGEIEFLGCD